MVETLYISTVFVAGLLSFFSPCILPVIPVYISYFADDSEVAEGSVFKKLFKGPMLKAIVFVLGLSTSFVLLGFGAGALGKYLYSKEFLIICGSIVVLLGIHQTGLVKLKFLYREKKLNLKRTNKADVIGAYLLGFTFSFGWTPCVGPILGAVLGLSASEGSAMYGGILMLAYSVGLMIPFLIVALFSEFFLKRIRGIYKHMNKIKVVGGLLIIVMGILLMTNKLNNIAVWFERLIN
jgi:cytochrome c-type biogenesis protein